MALLSAVVRLPDYAAPVEAALAPAQKNEKAPAETGALS
jgi:hypothetical protein